MDLKTESKVPVLIKFQSKEIIDSFQSGTVYMNELSLFRKMEESDDSHEVGDYMENKYFSMAYELPDGTPCNFISTTEDNRNNFIFCLFCVPADGCHFQFSSEQKEKLPDFGDTALVIQDFHEFISRVTNEAQNQGYKLHNREAVYYKENCEMTIEVAKLLTEGLYNFSFLKRSRYSYQQEYRLAVNMEKTEEDHIILDIGDISDISYQISTKQLLEEGIDT